MTTTTGAAPRLSPRQLQVLDAYARGLNTAETARELGIAPETVRVHRSHTYRRLGATTRAGALTRARAHGLLP